MLGPTPVDIVPAETQKSEIVMAELSKRATSGSFPAVANAEAEATRLNQGALEFMLGAQKMMFEEWVFLGDEMLERTRTEMHLFTEFIAKMAEFYPTPGDIAAAQGTRGPAIVHSRTAETEKASNVDGNSAGSGNHHHAS